MQIWISVEYPEKIYRSANTEHLEPVHIFREHLAQVTLATRSSCCESLANLYNSFKYVQYSPFCRVNMTKVAYMTPSKWIVDEVRQTLFLR